MNFEKIANLVLNLNPLYQTGLVIHEFHEKTHTTLKVNLVFGSILAGIVATGMQYYTSKTMLKSGIWGISAFVFMPVLIAVCTKIANLAFARFNSPKNDP